MAQKHMVVCVECGRQFDASRGAYYDKNSRRYTCKSCLKKYNANVREKQTGMKQSMGAMIAKIAFGALFVLIALVNGIPKASESPAEGITFILTGLACGAALLAWGLVPYLKTKKANDAAAAAAAAAAFELKNAPKKCPACGAMTKGDVCEYCGAALK